MSLNIYKYHSNPETITGFDQAMNSVPHLAWDQIFGTSDVEAYEELLVTGKVDLEELRKRERLWAKSREYSYRYAFYVLEGRFEKGEDAIATSAEYSYYYAADTLGGERVENIEAAIATDAEYSYRYAYIVLEGRFEKGEDAIRGSKYQERYEQLTGVRL